MWAGTPKRGSRTAFARNASNDSIPKPNWFLLGTACLAGCSEAGGRHRISARAGSAAAYQWHSFAQAMINSTTLPDTVLNSLLDPRTVSSSTFWPESARRTMLAAAL